MITAVQINSQPIDPCYVLAQVVVLHGRRAVTDGPTASSATVILYHPQGTMPPWKSGDVLELTDPAGHMFAGRIKDRTLAHVDDADGTRWGVFTITAAGTVARLGVRQVGDVPWPSEQGTARATRILTEAGTPYLIDGASDALVLARDVDAQTALTLLTDLQESTSAAVFDLPDGTVVYQPLSGRARPVFAYRWQDFEPDFEWDSFEIDLTWAGDPPSIESWPSPASEFPLVLDCSAVQWEPEWLSTESAVINHVRIGWGPVPEGGEQAYVDLRDDASIALHGRRYLYQGTDLATEAAARDHGTHILTTQGRERWALGEVIVHLDQLDPDTYAAALRLTCGDHVTIRDLPQPAPAIDWTGILEGWTYIQWGTEDGTQHETLTLALSDPLASLAVMTWDDYPTLYTWADHPGHLTWDDLNTTTILEAA